MKSASAPPRGGAREPGSYYWCSIWIVSIDYQSKRRDVCTAAQRLRSDVVVVVVWKFFTGGWAPAKSLNTATMSIIHVRSFESTSNHPSGVPPPSYEYYIHRTAQHPYTYASNPRPERSRCPPFRRYLATWVSSYRDWSPLLNTRASSYTLQIGVRAWVWALGQKQY